VIWRTEQVKAAAASRRSRRARRHRDPDRKFKIDDVVRRNTDTSLPASTPRS